MPPARLRRSLLGGALLGTDRPVAARRRGAEKRGCNLTGWAGHRGSGSVGSGVNASGDSSQRGTNFTDDLGNSRVKRTQIPSGHWRATIACVR